MNLPYPTIVSLALALSLTISRVAFAGGGVETPAFTDPPMCMANASCSDTSGCPIGLTCQDISQIGRFCVAPGQNLFCCTNGVCPQFNGNAGTCQTLSGPSFTLPICIYHGADLCQSGTVLTLAQVLRCYHRPVSATGEDYTRVWAEGDCDGDGIPNGIDSQPCVALVQDVVSVDATTPRDVVASSDVSIADDRTIADVVVTEDVTITNDDVTVADANSVDSNNGFDAVTVADSGSPQPPIAFRGSGCACRSSIVSRSTEYRFFSAILALFALLARRRRAPR